MTTSSKSSRNLRNSKSSRNLRNSRSSRNLHNSRSSRNLHVSKTLLQKALETGRGVYANDFVRFLAFNIITRNTTIEVTLTALLPKEIANIMIMTLRSWSDFKVYSERVLLDNIILPSTNELKNVIFSLSKIKFSYIESCIILVGKLLIVIAILKHQPKNYIIKLRKDLKV